jgi:hypothetical protein
MFQTLKVLNSKGPKRPHSLKLIYFDNCALKLTLQFAYPLHDPVETLCQLSWGSFRSKLYKAF